MLPHHAEVFRTLQSNNPDAEVYIATANKVEAGKSPFDAQEKLSIMTQQHDIPQDRIIIPAGNNLYNKDSYASTFTPAEQHSLFFAVGQKDMEESPRFAFKPLKDGSDSYLQNGTDVINTNNAQSMLKHGYVVQAPTVTGISGDVASASAFRNALLSAPDLDSAKQTYTKYMGEFNQEIFDLVYDKITGKIMKESLEHLKKLAGLLDEAPVNFAPGKGAMDYEPGVSKKDQKASAERPAKAAASNPDSVGFTKIAPKDMISVDTGKPINSRQRNRSMANQFPDGADINDPAVKKEMFLKLLAQSPGYVLGEINARLANDDDGFAVSDRLSNIIDNMPEGGIMALGDEDKKWTVSLVNNAINNMELHKKDAKLDYFKDLDGEEEPEMDTDMDEPEMVSMDDPEFDAPEDELEMEAKKDEPKNCGCGKNPCETYGNPEEAIEEEDDLNYMRQMAGLDIKEGKLKDVLIDVDQMSKEEFEDEYGDTWDYDELKAQLDDDDEPEMEESFDPQAEQGREEQAYDELTDAYQKGGEEGLCIAAKCSMEELDQEMGEISRDLNLHMDDDRDEIIQRYIETLVDNADWKDHGEPAEALDLSDMYSEEEEVNEFQQGDYQNDDLDDPDGDYVLLDKMGKEVKMLGQVPGLMKGTQLITISPPTPNSPAFILIKGPQGKQQQVTQDKLDQVGLKIQARGQGPEAAVQQRTPHQPQLPGMNTMNDESIDHAIDNALEETMLELKKLAGL
jgi:hypothetical protein